MIRDCSLMRRMNAGVTNRMGLFHKNRVKDEDDKENKISDL